MTLSNYLELKVLDKVCNGVDFTVTAVYVKLHLADPGEDCSANAAANTTRMAATFAAAASGAATSDAVVEWTAVSTTETYSHVSLWDAATSGNPLGSGALSTPAAVAAGDTFRLAAGDLTVTLD